MSKEHSEWLASLPPAEREALNKGLSALETMADLWAVEINLGKMSETIAGAPDHAKRAFAIKSLVEQGYIEGAYCTYLDYKNGKLPGQSARPEALRKPHDLPSGAPGDWRNADPERLEPYYSHWVSKLTTDDLHAKSDIATVLALLHQQLDDAMDDYLRIHREKIDLLFARSPLAQKQEKS